MKKVIKKLSVLIIAIVCLFTFFGCDFILDNPNRDNLSNSTQLMSRVEMGNIDSEDRELLSKAEVYEKYSQSVVAIYAIEDNTIISSGSGVIVDINSENYEESNKDFYIVTCHHVIDGFTEFMVCVPDDDGRNYGDDDYNKNYTFRGTIGGAISTSSPIRLIGGDRYSDVAVLGLYVDNNSIASDIQANKTKVMAQENKLRVGDDVVAIGNPKGTLPGTLLDGSVSYINRNGYFSGIGELSLIQINVGITGGSSGGALFNLYGELVGITNGGMVEEVLTEDENGDIVITTVSTNYNYAIPLYVSSTETNQGVVPIVSQLIATSSSTSYGYVTGRWILGVNFDSTDPVVHSVVSGGSADLAGIQAKDRIVSIEGEDISDIEDIDIVLNQLRKTKKAGDALKITIYRSSYYYDVTLTLQQYVYGG